MNMKQISVHQESRHLTTWVENDSRVKPGAQIELKGLLGFWTVDSVYSTILDKSAIEHSWNVGGL